MSEERDERREVVEHYRAYDESKRPEGDIGPLELARTKELMLRFLPPAPSVVLDVGGGTGVYALWLAGLGYDVHLVDVVLRHVELARRASGGGGTAGLASARVGDARHLALDDRSADVVIMHGPLYHLVERKDRVRAMEEARRVLRCGGVLLAFGITRYASLMYGLVKGHVFDADYYEMVMREVRTGMRENPATWMNAFPRAHFHHPDELADELKAAGFEHEKTLGVLGPAWMVPDLDGSWAKEAERDVKLSVARLTEDEPVLGPRLMAVGRRTQ